MELISGVKQLWVWWVVPTRHLAERKADGEIAAIPGGISLKIMELHLASLLWILLFKVLHSYYFFYYIQLPHIYISKFLSIIFCPTSLKIRPN
jgi:hypothetical protein